MVWGHKRILFKRREFLITFMAICGISPEFLQHVYLFSSEIVDRQLSTYSFIVNLAELLHRPGKSWFQNLGNILFSLTMLSQHVHSNGQVLVFIIPRNWFRMLTTLVQLRSVCFLMNRIMASIHWKTLSLPDSKVQLCIVTTMPHSKSKIGKEFAISWKATKKKIHWK